MNRPNETGIELLRRLVRAADYTREDAISAYTPVGIIRLFQACWASDYDILPDDLTTAERDHAARHGHLSASAEKRLSDHYGG